MCSRPQGSDISPCPFPSAFEQANQPGHCYDYLSLLVETYRILIQPNKHRVWSNVFEKIKECEDSSLL